MQLKVRSKNNIQHVHFPDSELKAKAEAKARKQEEANEVKPESS